MSSEIPQQTFDYVIVGTGPGGAGAARELARAGRSVCMVERGVRHEKHLGFPFGARILEGMGMGSRSEEGVYIGRGITVGGSSFVYNGNVYDPPEKLVAAMDLDMRPEALELKREIGVRTMPARFYANATGGRRVREAAERMGLSFVEQEKFIDPSLCEEGCDWCMFGCPRDAKFTTRRFVDDAVRHGATLLDNTAVDHVAFDKGLAAGVVTNKGAVIRGDNVILAAGGVGTPRLLMRSGVTGVGGNFFMDPMDLVVGMARDDEGGAHGEMSFTHAIESFRESDHFIISNLSSPWSMLPALLRSNVAKKMGPRAANWKRAVGLFVKLGDSPHGKVNADSITKPFTDEDERRMGKATDLCREMLERAGVDRQTITVARSIGGHPGGTVAMGGVVDTSFRCGRDNLFVCDGSVLPESPGVPPSLTIMAMSRLLGRMLLGEVEPMERKYAQSSVAAA
ncbi:MAG: FAD-dependent oxidoreductase [Desulfatibacillaceae bacterium]